MFILGTILMGFAAVNTGNNLLFLVVSGMLAFMAVTGIIGMNNLSGVQIALLPPEEVHTDRPAQFSLRISNTKKRFPSFLLTASCHGATTCVTFLAGSSMVDLPLVLQFGQRGRGSIRLVTISSPFPVNFFVRSWHLPVQCEFIVFPRQQPCRVTASGINGHQHASSGRTNRGFAGEVERIREYTGREPLKSIHWKLSAREEEFKVKEYGEPSSEPVLIDPARLPGSLEERVAGAAWLAVQWGEQRPVGLILGEEQIPPQQGRRQVRKILARLAVYGLETATANVVQVP